MLQWTCGVHCGVRAHSVHRQKQELKGNWTEPITLGVPNWTEGVPKLYFSSRWLDRNEKISVLHHNCDGEGASY